MATVLFRWGVRWPSAVPVCCLGCEICCLLWDLYHFPQKEEKCAREAQGCAEKACRPTLAVFEEVQSNSQTRAGSGNSAGLCRDRPLLLG